jgi:PKHD-type hydroxylase|tara:strand:- start:4778 stop:5368 length:591 start_codon:yes stop_codon:yes gene_type:complete
MNVNYTFEQQETDSQNFYFFQEGFSKEELTKIEKNVSNLDWHIAKTVGENEDTRKSNIKWIPQNEDWFWLYEKLANMAVEANDKLWKFDLHQIPEMIQYTEYHAPAGHYDWHADIGPGILSKRKVSITVQLSDPSEYEGGDLELFRGGSTDGPFLQAERNAGCVFLFPSYVMHRVTPVTRGTRKSFVLWLGGGHYK